MTSLPDYPSSVQEATADFSADQAQDWIQSSLGEDEVQSLNDANLRVWQGFMTARLMVAFLLLALQLLGLFFDYDTPVWLIVLCAAYLAFTLGTRLLVRPVPAGLPFERYWPITLGLDLLMYFLLVWFGSSEIANYIPLLVLPAVMCAVLGSQRLTLLTVFISSVLIGLASWRYYRTSAINNQILRFAGLGLYMLTMFLLTSILHRMARNYGLQQSHASASHQLLRLQGRIQDMLAQSVPDGVLVVGGSGRLRAINQAAQQILQMPPGTSAIGRPLSTISQIAPLQHLIEQSLAEGDGISSEVFLFGADGQATQLMVHSRLRPSSKNTPNDEPLCLLYLQDMQELQDQVRTEKLAAMGRMSAAVAHEIRNPLAAIGQAAQLLDEELQEPLQKKLNTMVQDNVRRLERIVSDVLDIARMQQTPAAEAPMLPLDHTVKALCDEWCQQHACNGQMDVALDAAGVMVQFEPEHLRRIMVNLLDNARRHGAQGPAAHVIVTTQQQHDMARLQVWSQGDPLPPPVLARLFEPFVAGPSRSTGLGLYICRELCQRHQADMHYQRLPAPEIPGQAAAPPPATQEGNAFFILLPVVSAPPAMQHAPNLSPSTDKELPQT